MTGPGLRRLLHAASGLIVLAVPLGSWRLFQATAVTAGLVGVGVEFARLWVPGFRQWLGLHVPVYRVRESARPSGAMWLGLGYALAAFVPAPAPAAGILVAALADPAASLAGTWRRAPGPKTWRGSATHAVVAAVVLAALGYSAVAVFAGAAVATALERFAFSFDDNLVVPPATALTVLLVG